jgi:hypothetical protein
LNKVCLIDADSKIPNIALMKISKYYKNKLYQVDLYKANLPYFPDRNKKVFNSPEGYDLYYCSIVFEGNKNFIKGKNIIFGGTGYDLSIKLPDEIEKCDLDYTIYPDNNTSYGFITRGCIRNCKFCVVPKKEGKLNQVDTIENIIKHKKVKFLDNNILAYIKHKEILQDLVNRKIKYSFNQGLDIRLIDNENSFLLSQSNYLGEYIFAFDDWSYKKIIDEKLKLLDWRKDWQLKFFIFCEPKMSLNNIINRIEYLKKNNCLPYIMRHISCWGSIYNDLFVDLAAYCNQPNLFKKMTFKQFLNKRHTNKDRIKKCEGLYYKNIVI